MAFTERSRANREAVLAAARHSFAERGFERTTVRAVAARAGLDPSMVIRYFGSKDELFTAAVRVDLRLPALADVPAGDRGQTLARHFLTLWEGPETADMLPMLLRAATTHEAAADRLREVFAGQVVALVAGLGLGLAEPVVARRAGLVATHVLGTALTRYVLRLPPVVALTPDEVVATLGGVLQPLLTPAAGAEGGH